MRKNMKSTISNIVDDYKTYKLIIFLCDKIFQWNKFFNTSSAHRFLFDDYIKGYSWAKYTGDGGGEG